MSKKHWLTAGLIVLGLAALIWGLNHRFKTATRFDWRELYGERNIQPYSSKLIYELTQDWAGSKGMVKIDNSIHRTLPTSLDSIAESIYVFVGKELYLSTSDYQSLQQYISKGGQAFIATQRIIGIPTEDNEPNKADEIEDATARFLAEAALPEQSSGLYGQLNLLSSETADTATYFIALRYKDTVQNFNWSYWKTPESGSALYERLGSIRLAEADLPNFIATQHGNGKVFLHSTPQAFSNVYLSTITGFRYANAVYEQLPHGMVYWDAVSHQPIADDDDEDGGDGGRGEAKDSPLRYILSQPALRAAWYLALALLLLYLGFRAKRKQAVVPVLEPKSNGSLAFVQTVGQLYFQHRNNKQLADQQWRLFLLHLRERYRLLPTENEDDFLQNIALKTGAKEEDLRRLFKLHRFFSTQPDITDSELEVFHRRIEAVINKP